MDKYCIEIKWEGPLSIEDVINTMIDEGEEEGGFDGLDYGVYQIYGPHYLYDNDNALLYVGQAPYQTFSVRLSQHKNNLLRDDDLKRIQIYLGRIDNPSKYTKDDDWKIWRRDVDMSEAILIYKYSPHYNSARLQRYPDLAPYKKVQLRHHGSKTRLYSEDNAPDDYLKAG